MWQVGSDHAPASPSNDILSSLGDRREAHN
jgi:hypothetical protein